MCGVSAYTGTPVDFIPYSYVSVHITLETLCVTGTREGYVGVLHTRPNTLCIVKVNSRYMI